MAFIQVLDFRAADYEGIAALDAQWRAGTEGKRTLRRSIVGRDRNDSTHYVVFAFFDSYDAAMANSELPETGAFAAQVGEIAGGSMTFLDLDVIEDQD